MWPLIYLIGMFLWNFGRPNKFLARINYVLNILCNVYLVVGVLKLIRILVCTTLTFRNISIVIWLLVILKYIFKTFRDYSLTNSIWWNFWTVACMMLSIWMKLMLCLLLLIWQRTHANVDMYLSPNKLANPTMLAVDLVVQWFLFVDIYKFLQ